MKFFQRFVMTCILGSSCSLYAADSLSVLRHELSNLQEEMRVIQGKILNQEDIIEALKQDVDAAKKKSALGNQKLHDSTIKGFAQDLKELKKYANQHAEHEEARIKDLEKTIQKQNENIEHLKVALNTLLDGFKGQDAENTSSTIYEVKSGDSLGLIAEKYHVSIKLIKDMNALKSDTIFKGQKLKIPDKQ